MAMSEGAERGRNAERPRQIPKRGWKDILLRTKEDVSEHFLGLAAAGVAFYSLLAIFPALAALVAVYGLVADPAQVQQQMSNLVGVLPPQARGLLEQQLQSLVQQSSSKLGLSALLGIAVSLWSATKGIKALFKALNIAYEEEETRGFFKLNGEALLFVIGGLLFLIFAVSLIGVLPAVLGSLGLQESGQTLANWLRWPLLLASMLLALAVLYRYGPSRDEPRWQWTSWGAVVATALWLLASVGFSLYVSNFSSYNETYGSMGAVVVLMMWLFLSAFAVLIGAELNAEMEHQTARDTTVGRRRPMGRRDAEMADTRGEPRA